MKAAVEDNMTGTLLTLTLSVIGVVLIIVLIAVFIASSITRNITGLVAGISRFRAGERQFRFNSVDKDEFKTLSDSFDEMAQSIENSVTSPLTIMDLDRKIIYMNESGLKIKKMTLGSIVGTSYTDSSAYPANTVYDPILALNEGREAEVYHLKETDQYIRGTANYLTDKDGKKNGYIVETVDMTEMVREQLKTEQQRLLLDKVFSASPDLIWYIDKDGRYITVNPRFAAMTGKGAEDIIGKTSVQVMPSTFAKAFDANDKEALSSDSPVYKEERMLFADNHEEILESVRVPIFDMSGALVGLLGYARNITVRVKMENDLRRTQLELEKAVNDANDANNHKSDFLARMSHEIRTPMNAIIGLTNIILKQLESAPDNRITADTKQKLSQIESSSQHLLGLLNDILDISKIEAGKIELSEEKMDIYALTDTVSTIIKPRCDDKKVSYVVEIDKFEPSSFIGDPLRLRQVLINLLGNSVKFTPEGGKITLKIKNLGASDDKTALGFAVCDTGIGISHEARENIFKPFEQANKNVSSKYGGTGLGLAISRNIVRLFGGDIRIESEVNKGSVFSFEIELTQTEPELNKAIEISDPASKFKGKRILLVDDIEINRLIISAMLEDTGAEIIEADDGLSALNTFADSEQGYFDIILMDIKMTHLDGYGATKQIRSLNRNDAARIPIVALTANAFKDDIDAALKAGMNAHIAKPVENEALMRILFKYLT